MERFTNRVRSQAAMGELRVLLTQVIAAPSLHARLVNTLSRMEYIGVRKMLKARASQRLDESGLQHIIEEASHALRLKRAAVKLNGGDEEGVRTYSEEDTLAGFAGEAYMQAVDRACEQLLDAVTLSPDERADINYLLSTTAIEIRAEAFYPLYEECLREAGAGFSVNAILKDELRHLAEMGESLAQGLGAGWEDLVERAVDAESLCFERWLDAVREQAGASAISLS